MRRKLMLMPKDGTTTEPTVSEVDMLDASTDEITTEPTASEV